MKVGDPVWFLMNEETMEVKADFISGGTIIFDSKVKADRYWERQEAKVKEKFIVRFQVF